MKEKISAVYQIINTITNDRYVGSSVDVKRRWMQHNCKCFWKQCPNKKLYQDMQKYGPENFRFQILASVMPEHLKQVEQEFIDMLNPTYNVIYAKGNNPESNKKYEQSDKGRETRRKYNQSERRKEVDKKYSSQPCLYNGEILRLRTLSMRFRRAGIKHATLEAKKYIIKGDK